MGDTMVRVKWVRYSQYGGEGSSGYDVVGK